MLEKNEKIHIYLIIHIQNVEQRPNKTQSKYQSTTIWPAEAEYIWFYVCDCVILLIVY